jgi:hypothetical protein
MRFENERHVCRIWRVKAPHLSHVVDTCACYTCVLCRGLESLILEVDRLTGAEGVGSGGVPGGV